MQVYISNREIRQIAEGLLSVVFGQPPPVQIDIDAVARYLGLDVVYEIITETDLDKIGFLSDGRSPLSVLRNGEQIQIIFPKDTIVLERFLLAPAEWTRRRFVLAHEIGHVLLNRADPLHCGACFDREYDEARSYSLKELHERMNLGECQANAMGTFLLMPVGTLTEAVQRHFRQPQIPVYGDCVFLPTVKPALQALANEIGVSHTALLIQLRKCGLLNARPMQEYFERTAIP